MIGIIDSGLGGLAVAQAIWKRLPSQESTYLADHAFFPYGNKTEQQINRRLRKIVNFFIKKNCRLIVIACNTITAAAIDNLRRQYPIPFVGTEPAVKLGGLVLATPTTVKSHRFQQLVKKYPVSYLACPGLAEAIEHGEKIEPFLPELPKNTSIVVLGCTHYILVKDQIQKHYGKKISLIDPSEAIAKQTQRLLGNRNEGSQKFFTTGDFQIASARASFLLKQRIIFSPCRL